jgi:hypothetical protein
MALGLNPDDYPARRGKYFFGLRENGDLWITRSANRDADHPQVAKLIANGIQFGSARYD